MRRVLVLGGSALTEPAAHALIQAGHEVRVYWSRGPHGSELSTVSNLRAALAEADAVVDTTHPFDQTLRGIAVAMAPQLPRARVGRAPWHPDGADAWTQVDKVEQAVAALPSGACVFAASGRDSAEVLTHHDGPVFLRQLHRHDDPAPEGCTYVFGDGPYDAAGEEALFRELEIDVVLARNTGGTSGYPKVAAARALGLPMVLIAQPKSGVDHAFTEIDDLVSWVAAL
ncbi:precorrin-6A/cobalt-precorrin-6A reductase [uncultured Tateyamaria sp.]|uniref:precorrin-6A/cobalt-precorrin-6A reductase n=1 Tax=uncultured Tateyamaria sp. TaxID=455651 RepID=UPI0026171C49|nr:precorrin-6A/cobalt-precorrin-6A reductase [uncultured Tateyamaria sp.]